MTVQPSNGTATERSITQHLCTVRKMDLTLRCIQRRLQMQRSMARKFMLQPYRR
jgi:hypothetical protein